MDYARFLAGWSCQHLWLNGAVSPGGSSLAVALAVGAEYWTFAAHRTLEPGAHSGQFQSQLCHRAAQRIAVHPQLFRGLALVAPVLQPALRADIVS